ncbi:DUF6344 domain-containing protein [Streptomyces daliensis]
MGTAKTTQLWTAFITVLCKLLAHLGFATRRTATVPAYVPASAQNAAAGATVPAARGTARTVVTGAGETGDPGETGGPGEAASRGGSGDTGLGFGDEPEPERARKRRFVRSKPKASRCVPPPSYTARRNRRQPLPPTIKQRIRAEAHGSSPSSRTRSSLVSDALVSDHRGGGAASAATAAPKAKAPAPTASAAGRIPSARARDSHATRERVLSPAA